MRNNLDPSTSALLRDGERLRLIEANVRDYALVTFDKQERITGWNAGAERILGWLAHEVMGQPGTVFFTPEDRAAGVPEQEFDTAAVQGRAEDRHWHVRKGGERFWASGILTALRDEAGELHGYVKILRDLTERHQEREETAALLRASEAERARLTSLFVQAPAFIAILRGPTHIFEMANPLYYQLVGNRDILSKPVREALPEIEGQGFFELLDTVYQSGTPFTGSNMRILLRTGVEASLQERYLDFVYQPLLEADGTVSGVFVHGVDFTARGQAQTEIENLNRRLRRSVQETHHRVKNNLQVIGALAELQMEGSTVPVAALARIAQHTRSLAAIHDLLTQEAKTSIEAEFISVQAAMNKLMPLLQATAGGQSIRYTVQDFRLAVREGTSLALLVSEMVSNALKHGRTQIDLTLRVEEDKAYLEVCDDGPGFPSDFDWRTAANTGLGLIDSTGRHDLRGTITYDNRPEGGAKVTVVFPISRAIQE